MSLDLGIRTVRLKWLDWFREVEAHPARVKAVSGGRGILKTTQGMEWLAVETLTAKWRGDGVYTANTYRQAARVGWPELMRILDRWENEFDTKLVVGTNETKLTIKLIEGRSLILIGMDNYDAARGIHPVVNLNDEIAKSRQAGFLEVMDPACENHEAKVLDVTTPRKSWWKGRWEEGWGPNRAADTMSWRVRTEDTGMMSKKSLDRLRRLMGPALYAQEMEGEFTGAEGPVFPEFVRKMFPAGHLVPIGEARRKMAEGGYMIGAMDWGRTTSMAVLLWIWVTKRGTPIFLDSLRCKNTSPQQMVTQARRKTYGLPPITILDSQCWATGDMGHNTAQLFTGAGLKVRKADKRFDASLQKMRQLMILELKDDFPSFAIVAGTCEELQEQLDTLQEEDISQGGYGFKDKINVDDTDAARYGIMGVRGTPTTIEPWVARGPVPVVRPSIRTDNIRGWHPVTGAPVWEGDDADA